MAGRKRLISWAGLVVLLCVSAWRVAGTYSVFSGTFDEPYHVAVGMQWIDHGRYTYEWFHPPLGRVAVATAPYWAGLRSHSERVPTKEGNLILTTGGEYRRNLALARMGTLPFLMLAAVVVFLWGRRWYSTAAGLWGAALFLSLPAVLGHAGLATIDVACMATVALALYRFLRWVEMPNFRNGLLFGVAVGVALLTKFSSLAFLAAGCGAAMALRGVAWRRAGMALAVAAVTLVTVWAGYRFHVGPMSRNRVFAANVDKALAERPAPRGVAHAVMDTPLPLTAFVGGMTELFAFNRDGHDSYFMGQFVRQGRWYFFPVILGLKTPPGFLVLSLAGLFFAFLGWRERPWPQTMTALFATGVLGVCMLAGLNLGIRHVLAVYPLLAVLAGHMVDRAWGGGWVRVVAVGMAGWAMVEGAAAHPDYLAYFNGFAGGRPELVVAESDLDWGQDLYRLGGRLRELDVKKVAVGYFGTAPLEVAGLPEYTLAVPGEKTAGWVAVSVRMVTLENAKTGAYGWLKGYAPVERIGRSILLYRVAE